MQNIETILTNIEQTKNVTILYACETGSRAWGFPSPDSDYDIRFIYMHNRDWYLSLNQRKDTIEIMDGDLDITGWDLKKCLMLLKKSNAPLIERFQSPVTYFETDGFKQNFRVLIETYYSPAAVFYHHYSLAKKFWADIMEEEQYKLKNWFYLVRSLLSCNWIVHDKTVLPMDIYGLMKYINAERRNQVEKLITLKENVGEKYLHPKDEELNKWINDLFSMLETSQNNLGTSKADMSLLNEFFLKQLYA